MDQLVYLAGPITGLTWKQATDWRLEAQQLLRPLYGVNPIRMESYLENVGPIPSSYTEPLSSGKIIVKRARFEAQRCQGILINLLGATQRSIGTIEEMVWAEWSNKPCIVIMEPKNNVHDHPFVRELAWIVTSSLDQACYYMKALLEY